MVNDFGTVINPLLVEGQSHGGVVQGIGQALFEHVVYSEEGQPLTGSFTDYALPRAADAPSFGIGYHSVPAKTNVAGRQGLRRGGLRGLAALGDERHRRRAGRQAHQHAGHPERVWEALHSCSFGMEDVAIVGYGPVGALARQLCWARPD